MRLLISANSFYPRIGGYEQVALLIARLLHARGLEVRVVTLTPEEGGETLPFPVIRNPGAASLLQLVQWCNLYLQNNVSLRLLWPLLVVRRPLLVVHHGFYRAPDEHGFSWRFHLKQRVIRRSTNIAVSRAVAAALPAEATVCANPYRDDIFFRVPSIAKDRELLFVGRLVSEKGVDLLIEALVLLDRDGIRPRLTIVGSGPEEAALRRQAGAAGIGERVEFAGTVKDEVLNRLINAHKLVVVPTRTREGFGLVALEAIACGCVVVGASDGGLAEAIGPCGRIFAKGDVRALATTLRELLAQPALMQAHMAHAPAHLQGHRPQIAADRYLEVIQRLAGAR
jgi:glycosyltransferase involved in cell wall biosynthesis